MLFPLLERSVSFNAVCNIRAFQQSTVCMHQRVPANRTSIALAITTTTTVTITTTCRSNRRIVETDNYTTWSKWMAIWVQKKTLFAYQNPCIFPLRCYCTIFLPPHYLIKIDCSLPRHLKPIIPSSWIINWMRWWKMCKNLCGGFAFAAHYIKMLTVSGEGHEYDPGSHL